MIDFRYHLVSIIAVFLALAVGLVVGATALAPKTEAVLSKLQTDLSRTNANLTKDRQALTNQVSADQIFAGAASQRLLTGLLAGERAVVVVAPGGDSAVTAGVTAALRKAGAKVTGIVSLSTTFLDTGGQNEATLTSLAQNLAVKAGVTLPTQSASPVAGQQDAAKVLAAALLARHSGGLATGRSAAVLTAFSQAGYVTVSGASPLPSASLAVLVAPGGPPPQTGAEVLVATAAALRNAGDATVMAGSVGSVGSGSVVTAEDSAGSVSTVDNADTETGQIMTVQALRLLLDGRAPGQYGIAPQAAPSPAPAPSATPSVTTSPSPGGHS